MAQAVTGPQGVLLMEADLVFVAQRRGDPALRPFGGRFAEFGLGQHQDAARLAQFDGGAQSGNAAADDDVIDVMGIACFHGSAASDRRRSRLC